nr:MAG TPA: hypothetical protein [Caudoviricetes sp.]
MYPTLYERYTGYVCVCAVFRRLPRLWTAAATIPCFAAAL